ncbi:ribosome small subunit-dependent GTPase A [Aquimarina sp. ERC-38]|uniref:ribosome small subunit-dependent GTPase A n=1 Tax=Aquimarina sp. ERC-38 TaxID=2949996 RepID=UPI002247A96A|nr:ribosome small subunit-dependent GTPase A [Aquimarina sp. ERC-38]UZO80976.1 ribosome small subunit-dependent GTPase A [Aquimarina sp. ERC-38]
MIGTVYKSTGSWYLVKGEDHMLYECRIKGKFRLQGIKSTNPVAVGDKVVFELETESDKVTGVISEIKDRKNYIIRKSVNLSKQTHIIAANIDICFLVITLNNPPTFASFIDRFLVTAEAYDIKTVLLFNKIDTYTSEEMNTITDLIKLYENIGYTCLQISAKHKVGIDQVIALMEGKVCMFSGHSGVGKSTLVNTLAPELSIKTAEISNQHQQGQHTTTFAEMYDLSFNARIIDTPGIKGFGVVDMEKEEIGDYFPEFFALKSTCKFNNCLHVNEPKCAVKDALKNGQVAASRYKSYLQILDGEEDTYRKNNYEIE